MEESPWPGREWEQRDLSRSLAERVGADQNDGEATAPGWTDIVPLLVWTAEVCRAADRADAR